MTFEEYWNNLPDFYRSPFDNVKAAAEKAFNEATKIEREACAKLCDEIEAKALADDDSSRNDIAFGKAAAAESCAEAIRAR